MPICARDGDDPLVERLYREQRLCLVRFPWLPAELAPGSLLAVYPRLRDREPEIYSAEDILDPLPPVALRDGEYQPLNITENSNALTVETVARLAEAMGRGLPPAS